MKRVRVGVIGVGLIGGSIARRIKFSGFAYEVIGVGRNPERLKKAVERSILDEVSTEYGILSSCDVVVISTPIAHIVSNLPKILESVKPGTLVLDVGSVKRVIVQRYEEIRSHFPSVDFVPSHPIAGSHHKGFESSRKDLFMGRPAVLCPVEGTRKEAVDLARLFYNFLGMDVFVMDAEDHDRALAYTSHLPHLISFAYRDVVDQELIAFSGGAFKDLTRIANADLHLWNGIFRTNLDYLALASEHFLKSFEDKIQSLRKGCDVVVGFLPESSRDGIYTVAIDGPAGAGKSTIAKLLAMRLGFRLIDTGAMYRAGTLACMRKGVDWKREDAIVSCVKSSSIELTEDVPPRILLNGEDVSLEIRRPEVTRNVVFLARNPQVREYMVSIQREMALRGRAVIEGRDVTTVVIPEARFKFYLDASFEERVRRRHNDLRQKRIEVDLKTLESEMLERDASDLQREVGPLRRASDAFYVDSTKLSVEETLNVIFYEIKRRIGNEEIEI